MPEASPVRRVLRLHWSDRTGNGNKIVIGGAQLRGKFNSKLKGWKLGKDQECGRVSKAVRDTGRVWIENKDRESRREQRRGCCQ